MDIVLICVSTVLFSLQFLFQKNYSEEYGSSVSASLVFNVYSSIVGAVLVFIIGYFFMEMQIEFSWFSVLLALAYAVVRVACIIVSSKALDSANLALYSMFMMLGGMLLPFLYGVIFRGEELNWQKIVGIVVIAVVLAVSSVNKDNTENKGNFKKNLFYYISVFTLNGLYGVITSIHQMEKYKETAVDSYQFSLLFLLFACVIALAWLLITKQKLLKLTPKIFGFTACFSAVNSLGELFLVIALLTLPSSVQFPVVTGGTIIVSCVISCIEEKRINIKFLVCAIIALLSTMLFVI